MMRPPSNCSAGTTPEARSAPRSKPAERQNSSFGAAIEFPAKRPPNRLRKTQPGGRSGIYPGHKPSKMSVAFRPCGMLFAHSAGKSAFFRNRLEILRNGLCGLFHLKAFFGLEVALAAKPVLHGGLQTLQGHVPAGLEKPVAGRQQVVKDRVVGKV